MTNKHNVVLLSADGRYAERRTARTDAAVSRAALRMRQTRERRRNGIIVLQDLELTEDDVERLISAGLLDPWTDDRQLIAQAIKRLIGHL